jgi:transcriptional regulator with XRE-family HTH domain
MAADPNVRMSRKDAKRVVGESIRRNRIAFGMSQQELGDLVGVSGATVSSWERGISEPGSYSLDIVRGVFKTMTRERQMEQTKGAREAQPV